MRNYLEANMFWIGMAGAFAVSGLLYVQHPDKLGDAVGTLAVLVAVVADADIAPASAVEFLSEERDA